MKMKLFLITAFCFLSVKLSCAQAPYEDAIKLSKLLVNGEWPDNTNTITAVKDILSHYCKRTEVADSFLENNPFMSKFAINWVNRSSGNNPGLLSVSSAFSAVGGINVSNIADGLAKFLVERAKQELSIAFFRDFKETLEKPEYKHLRTLFPNTMALLKTIDKDIYRFSAYIQSLREAFIKDLDNIFDTAPQAITDGLLDKAFNASSPPHLKEIFIYALQIAKGLKHGTHPGLIIENFNLITPVPAKPTLTDINAVLKIVKLFSASLRSVSADSKTYWASQDSIGLVLSDVNTARIYLGIMYHKAVGIQFSNGSFFRDHMATAVNDVSPYIDLIMKFKDKCKDVEEAIGDIRDKKKADISYNEYYRLFRSITDVLRINEDIEHLPGLAITVPQHFKTFVAVAENCNELFLDISLKKYSTGIMRLVMICDTLLQPAYDKYPANKTAGVELPLYKNFRKYLIKYGTFIASIADAKNSDEVKAAIEAAVLPVGSASIKRETDFNISLNAFIGPYGGWEYLPKLKEKKGAASAGVTAPIGLAFSWGNKKLKETRNGKAVGGKSLSIFIPVIDIGALASYRLSNDSSNIASEVKLKNIISPGLYFYYGFGKYPISIGAGAQLGPQLREISATDINIDKNYYIRFALNLVVDIPFFNFYTRGN